MFKTKKSQSTQLELNIQQLPSKKKRKKKEKSSCLASICQIINRIPIHHIVQLMNMLKPTLHFPIEDARSVN